ncbi:MAG: glycoside hydrolase family 31 protein [Chloroflexi bacterium]|nr:glycoside hydrolase family 31 protein [Chloroflexota bacterium]MCL5273535.1 glycoside hydrolase family 31 protein [Chloroflexota bacterium]
MASRFRALNDLHEVSQADGLVTLTGKHGALELAVLSGGVLRVRMAMRNRLAPYQSLALAGQPEPVAALVEAHEGGLTIQAAGVTATVTLEPLTLAIGRAGGAVLAQDIENGALGDRIVVRKRQQPGQVIYGLGEKTGWLDKRYRRYRMENTDVFLVHPGITATTDPMYASFPFFIVHSAAGDYGIFVDNPEFTEFDFTRADRYEFSAPAQTLVYYVLPGPGLQDVLRQYTELTGRMPLPALWPLGYHQCRWGYKSEADLREIAAELRQRSIPADALWCDIDYMDGYRVFTWNNKGFPHPAELTADLAEQGLHVVTIIDPGVKVDAHYAVYREGKRNGYFVRHANGREYNGAVWPGRSAFPDFHAPKASAWWAGNVKRWQADYGIAGIWIDMNEPASTDMSGPIETARHACGKLPHASARNTYALQMARATYAGMIEHDPDSRPFILTRAAYSGAQTVTAQWLGDNSALWEHLAASLPMLMNMGLSGMPFVGVDVGGFAGDTNPELLARWTQAGAFYPFYRNHAIAGAIPQEPWRFGPEIEAICRRYIGLRYQLLPYLYNLFHEAAQTGAPIMRPLVWHYPKDEATFNLHDQFLLGQDLLVAPVLYPGLSARSVYLPKGVWYRWRSGGDDLEAYDGPAHVNADAPLDELPLFVRGGAIIPMWPLAQHTGAIDRAGLRLHIWPGRGKLDFYEDDGNTRAYERGPQGWRVTPFQVSATAEHVTVKWSAPRGKYADARTDWTFVLHGLPEREVTLDGQPVAHTYKTGALSVRIPDDRARHTLAA